MQQHPVHGPVHLKNVDMMQAMHQVLQPGQALHTNATLPPRYSYVLYIECKFGLETNFQNIFL